MEGDVPAGKGGGCAVDGHAASGEDDDRQGADAGDQEPGSDATGGATAHWSTIPRSPVVRLAVHPGDRRFIARTARDLIAIMSKARAGGPGRADWQ